MLQCLYVLRSTKVFSKREETLKRAHGKSRLICHSLVVVVTISEKIMKIKVVAMIEEVTVIVKIE